MLPKNRRIPRGMFPLLSGRAKVFKNKLFLLKFVPNKENRFGFSVSKKVAKNAVMRNETRRAGYRFLEKFIPEIKQNILASFSFKILPKNEEEIIQNMESILKKSKLIK